MTLTEPTTEPDASTGNETTIPTDTLFGTEAPHTSMLKLGSGWVTIDAGTGAPLQFTDTTSPERKYLLDSDVPWHSVEHAWGTGHVITDTFTGRWNAPDSITVDHNAVAAGHAIGGQLTVEVERRGGQVLGETYRFRNISDRTIRITSLGIQTPFADLYPGASDALARRVHAHVFTGGAWAWVAAQPMNGTGQVLGLRVTEGQLWGYAVETRNANTISNARGHLVLHVTDHARNPDAFGGQPIIELAAGEQYVLSWEIAWHQDINAFLSTTAPPAEFSTFTATVGNRITIRTPYTVRAADGIDITPFEDGARITAQTPGTYWVQIGEHSRTEVLFHPTVREAVRSRGNYVLAHQRSTERPGLLAKAIVPVDTKTRLTQATNGWSDWTDGSERIGVAIMLQQGLNRGWLGAAAESALDGWAAFARTHLIDDSAAPRRGSQQQHAGIRLYDSPWLARFFLVRYTHSQDPDDLNLAARLLERALELGIARVLTIGFSEIMAAVADTLVHAGQEARAEALRGALIASAYDYSQLGADLPGHEVAYEQAIVAPLLNLLIDAHRLTGDPVLLGAIQTRLPWLLAFGGPQPHARLNGIAIRHWDGYWFGQRRQWGDVFPHYWSALTATVLLRLPKQLRTTETDNLANNILRANMANYFPDGSATCAFVMPTSVDGIPAHAADPLANDQDFHLAVWMQLESDGITVLP